ncbi:MAG: hypothetical protein WAK01_18490 [Methylocystis sp.]
MSGNVSREKHADPADTTLSLLFFGLMGAPAAWAMHLFANYILASRRCFPDAARHRASTPLPLDDRLTLFGVDAIAVIIAALALFVSFRIWRDARDRRDNSEAPAVADRTKFLSSWGMICAGLFLLALVFDLVALGTLPRCG